MKMVIDASVALTWALPDEANPIADRAMEKVADFGAIAPAFFKAECANVLAVSVRRGRIGSDVRREILSLLSDLDIEYDQDALTNCWGKTADIAETHGLSVYDAMYLETAMRTSSPLSSLDKALRRAATEERVEVFG
ncbi:MAG: type II toxin-antitoxin system VapC family toxin [Pseudomonadota bacterium]